MPVRPFTRPRTRDLTWTALLFALVAIRAALGQELPPKPTPPPGGSEKIEPDSVIQRVKAKNKRPADPTQGLKMVPPRPADTLLAKSQVGNITLQNVLDGYSQLPASFQPRAPIDKVAAMPADWLDRVTQIMAVARALELRVDRIDDPKLQEEYRQGFNQYLLNIALPEAEQRAIKSRIKPTPDEELKSYYDQHRPEFLVPPQFKMRHLFLMTYDKYEVRQGDTLEAIAEKMIGDRSRIGDIRSDVEGRPVRWVKPEDRGSRMFKPLEPGEKLLVPMSDARAAQVRKRMTDLLASVGKGKSFEAVANEFSEGESKGQVVGPLPAGGRPMLPELLQAATNTEPGKISPIFRTKHGFNAIEIVEKTGGGYPSFDQTRTRIEGILHEAQVEKLQAEFLTELYSLPELKVDYDALAKPSGLSPETVVIRAGKREFQWKDLESFWKKQLGDGAGRKEIDKALREFPPLNWELTLIWLDREKAFEDPDLKSARANLRTAIMARLYTEKYIASKTGEIATDEAVNQFYEARKHSVFVTPLSYSYSVLTRKPAGGDDASPADLERLRKTVTEELKAVPKIEDFVSLAKSSSTQGSQVEFVNTRADALQGPIGEQVLRLKTGQWSGAFVEGKNVVAVGVTGINPQQPRPLEEVRPEVVRMLQAEASSSIEAALNAEVLKEIQYEFVLAADQ